MTDKPKRPRDANQLAAMIVGVATGEREDDHDPDTEGQRKGGLKGGKERAKVLTEGRKREIAKKGAKARWEKSEVKEE